MLLIFGQFCLVLMLWFGSIAQQFDLDRCTRREISVPTLTGEGSMLATIPVETSHPESGYRRDHSPVPGGARGPAVEGQQIVGT